MADFDYHGADYGMEGGSRLGGALRGFGIANWVGAVTSVGLTAGLVAWVVDLTFRDVSTVPVIAALEGPMRVAPADPGGAVAPFQGMALSDITSGGAASPAPETIVLAPPPVALDAPALSERIAAAEVVVEAEDAALAEVEIVEEVVDVATDADAEVPADGAIDFRSAIAAAIAEVQPGVASSPRPRPRPAALRSVAAATGIEAPAQRAGIVVASLGDPDRILTDAAMDAGYEVEPSALPAGTRAVQLGAFDSPASARGEWVRLEARFADYMAGKMRMLEPASVGGQDFWRLRAVGFAGVDDSRRFCAALAARGAECIPVTVR